jgi:hypothetical protein
MKEVVVAYCNGVAKNLSDGLTKTMKISQEF